MCGLVAVEAIFKRIEFPRGESFCTGAGNWQLAFYDKAVHLQQSSTNASLWNLVGTNEPDGAYDLSCGRDELRLQLALERESMRQTNIASQTE